MNKFARYALKKAGFLDPKVPKNRVDQGYASPNEAVNYNMRTIFVAIPKTGTTTVREQIRSEKPYFLNGQHLNIVQIRDLIYIWELYRHLGKNINFPSDSVFYDSEIRQIAHDTFSSFFKFSLVRNPWARVVSMYFRREGVQTRSTVSFADFCRNHHFASDTCFYPTKHDNQIDWVTDEKGDVIVDMVVRLEDLAEKRAELLERSGGRVELEMGMKNNNRISKSKNYQDVYDAETKGIIASRFEKDIDAFKYTF